MQRRPRRVRPPARRHSPDVTAGRFATPGLTLPKIGRGIPSHVEQIDTGAADFTSFARSLAAAGIFREQHLEGGHTLISNLAPGKEKERDPLRWGVGNALSSWLYDLFAGADGVDPMSWDAGVTHDLAAISNIRLFTAVPLGQRANYPTYQKPGAAFYFSNPEIGYARPVWAIGAGISMIEDELQGGGQWVYAVLDRAFRLTCGVFGPGQAMKTCQYIHWDGGLSERERVAFLRKQQKTGGEPMSAEQVMEAEGIIPLSRWQAIMPEWAWKRPKAAAKVRRPSGWKRAQGRAGVALECAGELAGLLDRTERHWRPREIAGYATLNDAEHLDGLSWFTFPIICRWTDDDMIPDLFDDGINEEYDNGSEMNMTDHTLFTFAADDELSLIDACRRIEAYAEILRCIGELLNTIGTSLSQQSRLRVRT